MRLHEREHRRYILRRMVYELFGVGGEDGGRGGGGVWGPPLMKGFYRKVKENSKMNWRKTL